MLENLRNVKFQRGYPSSIKVNQKLDNKVAIEYAIKKKKEKKTA